MKSLSLPLPQSLSQGAREEPEPLSLWERGWGEGPTVRSQRTTLSIVVGCGTAHHKALVYFS